MSGQYKTLPEGLPVPVDDGLAAHIPGMRLPNLQLISTSGDHVNLATIKGWLVLYIYPLSGRPGVPLPEGWNDIPGARGCTPQACDFSDHHQQLQNLGAQVFGLSSQATDYQAELHDRLHLPFDLLSDSNFALQKALNLPVFEVHGMQQYKRLTLIAKAGIIKKVFYPVFPPNQNARQVINWLENQ